MPKFLFEAAYTLDGIRGIRQAGGSSRRDAIAQVAEAVGGHLESVYFAFGESDVYVTVEELGGPPGGLYTDYCECVSGPVSLVSFGRPPETLECQGSYGLPYSDGERREVSLVGRGWRVTEEYTLPVDPHLDIRVDAICTEL